MHSHWGSAKICKELKCCSVLVRTVKHEEQSYYNLIVLTNYAALAIGHWLRFSLLYLSSVDVMCHVSGLSALELTRLNVGLTLVLTLGSGAAL